MESSEAEIARTLARTRVASTVHIACQPGPWTARYATDCAGRPLLLARGGDALATALAPRPGGNDVAVAVCVEDQVPLPGAPSLGRVWVSGWASVVRGDARRRAAAIEFAEANPIADLLDIDDGMDLYRVEIREVRLETRGSVRSIDPEEYTAADPDPLRDIEAELLLDLTAHHGGRIRPYLQQRLLELGVLVAANERPRAVRLDRYGLLVAPHAQGASLGGEFVRLPFARPMRDRLDLARLLHPVLFPNGCQAHHH